MKKENNVGRYILTSAMMLAIGLIFSLFSLIMIIDTIPDWVRFLVSFIFIAPIWFMTFTQGKREGEKLYKKYAKTTLDDMHNEKADKIPYHRCVYHVLGMIVPLSVLFILGVALKNTVVRLIAMIFEFPLALMFSAVGVLDTSVVTPVTLAIFLPYTLIWAGLFVLGYLLKIWQLRKQHAELRGEIRMFDN